MKFGVQHGIGTGYLKSEYCALGIDPAFYLHVVVAT